MLLRVATLAFVIAAIMLAVHQSRRDNDDNQAELLVDPLASELSRCRTITPEQNAADDSCRRAWAESRRRFFAPSLLRSDAATNAPSSTVTGKSQDRLPSADVLPNHEVR